MVDRIRYPTVSYLPFYYVFFQFLLLTIFNLQANILTAKDILSNLVATQPTLHQKQWQQRQVLSSRNSKDPNEYLRATKQCFTLAISTGSLLGRLTLDAFISKYFKNDPLFSKFSLNKHQSLNSGQFKPVSFISEKVILTLF